MKKKKVLCFYCDKFLGWNSKKKEYINLKQGTIQEGRGMNKSLRSFCNKKCQKNYHFILDRLTEMEERVTKLEAKFNG